VFLEQALAAAPFAILATSTGFFTKPVFITPFKALQLQVKTLDGVG